MRQRASGGAKPCPSPYTERARGHSSLEAGFTWELRGSRHSELSRFATFPVNRPPAASTAAGLAAAAAKLAPAALALEQLGQAAPAPLSLTALAALATTLWGSYLLALPRTAALLEPRREAVLRQIARE